MKRIDSLPRANLGASSPSVAAHLRGELPPALQGAHTTTSLLPRQAMSTGLLDDLCKERPDDCRFWDVLRDPQARVVATGQQPGAVGGSLLVLYKAATAVALAQALQKREGVPVVPVFWNATDDVDFDEIATVGWHSNRHGLFYLQLPRQDWHPESFIGDLPASGDQAALTALQEQLPGTTAERLQDFSATSARDHGDWVEKLLRRIFPQLLVLDARSAALRRHAAPLFQAYLDELPAAQQAIEAQIQALQALGHQRVLSPASIRMGLFLTGGNRRQKTEDASVLLQQIQKDPAGVSPNVILRPLVQDQLLPTVAAIVGPAELAYHLELQSLRAFLHVPQPALLSRLSGTVLPLSLWLELQQHDVDLQSWLRSPQDAMQAVGRARAAASIQQVEALWNDFDRRLQQLRVSGADETALQRARKGLQPLRQRLSRDIVEEHSRRILDKAPGLLAGADLVQPGQRMQERVLAGLWLYAQQGTTTGACLVRDATEHLRALEKGEDNHAVWVVDDVPSVASAAQQGEA